MSPSNAANPLPLESWFNRSLRGDFSVSGLDEPVKRKVPQLIRGEAMKVKTVFGMEIFVSR